MINLQSFYKLKFYTVFHCIHTVRIGGDNCKELRNKVWWTNELDDLKADVREAESCWLQDKNRGPRIVILKNVAHLTSASKDSGGSYNKKI